MPDEQDRTGTENQRPAHPLETLTRPTLHLGARIFTPVVLFLLILAIGIFSRVWQFGRVPPGLNIVEASIGVDANDLYHYGVDRNGASYPVNFIAWGQGSDALYGYMLLPFMPFGLTPTTERLPALLTGILTLPLIFFIAKRILGRNFGLLAMFLLAISPWHILMSRWGLNENILPFVAALGFACLLASTPKNIWFIVSAFFFGLCFYAYGGSYVAIPILLLGAIPILWVSKRISLRNLIIGLIVLAAMVFPIALFVLVNSLGWNTIHLGMITIPRLSVQARFLTKSAISKQNPILAVLTNIRGMIRMLFFTQTDNLNYNSIGQYGYMYTFSLPFIIIGTILLIARRKIKEDPESYLLLSWLVGALAIGAVEPVNFNRIHMVFIPLILCLTAGLAWLWNQRRLVFASLIGLYLLFFATFTVTYHGSEYKQPADQPFPNGILPALNVARLQANHPICVTDHLFRAHIYALFSDPINPSVFLSTVKYLIPTETTRGVISFGRYSFGLANCANAPGTVYVLMDEQPPNHGIAYKVKDYLSYHVYIPKTGTP